MSWNGRIASGGSSRSGSRCNAARSTPIAAASSSSASSSGMPTRAARSPTSALSSASRTGMPLSGRALESLTPLEVLERLGERVEVAGEDLLLEIVRGDADAVVGDAVLGEVVGADLLGPLAGADLGAAVGGELGLLLGRLGLVEAGAQHAHGLVPV